MAKKKEVKEKNKGGRPSVFQDDVATVLSMSVPLKQKEKLRAIWQKDIDKFKISRV